MSSYKKQAALPAVLTLPALGSAIGAITSLASTAAKNSANAAKKGIEKSIKATKKGIRKAKQYAYDNDIDPKENARRLLRGLIMGGGIGLGVGVTATGGKMILDNFNKLGSKQVKSAKANSKLLVKLLKQAAGTNDYWKNQNTNYLLGGGTGLLGGLLAYNLLNDKDKRKFTGYLGAGLSGLGIGLGGAGAYNQYNYGSLFNPATTPAHSIKKAPLVAGKTPAEETSSAGGEETPAEESSLGTEVAQSIITTGLPWIEGAVASGALGGGVKGLATSFIRNRRGKFSPSDLIGKQTRVNNANNPLNKLTKGKLRKFVSGLANVGTLGTKPLTEWGANRLGDYFWGGNLSPDELKAYSGTQQIFANSYGDGELPSSMPKGAPAGTEIFTNTHGGANLSNKARTRLYIAERNARRMELIAGADSTNKFAARAAKYLRSYANKLWSGANFGEMPSYMVNNIVDNYNKTNGTKLDPKQLKDVKFTRGGKLKNLLDVINETSNPSTTLDWYQNPEHQRRMRKVQKNLPKNLVDLLLQGEYISQHGPEWQGANGTTISNWTNLVNDYNSGKPDSYQKIQDAVNYATGEALSKPRLGYAAASTPISTGITHATLETAENALREVETKLDAANRTRSAIVQATGGYGFNNTAKEQLHALDSYINQLEQTRAIAQEAYNKVLEGKGTYGDLGIKGLDAALLSENIPSDPAIRERFEQMVHNLNDPNYVFKPEELTDELKSLLKDKVSNRALFEQKQEPLEWSRINNAEVRPISAKDISPELRALAEENPALQKLINVYEEALAKQKIVGSNSLVANRLQSNINTLHDRINNIANDARADRLDMALDSPRLRDVSVSPDLLDIIRESGNKEALTALKDMENARSALKHFENYRYPDKASVDALREDYINAKAKFKAAAGGLLREPTLIERALGLEFVPKDIRSTGSARADVALDNLFNPKPVEEAGNTEKTPARRKTRRELTEAREADLLRWEQEQQKADTQVAPASNTIKWNPNFTQKIIDAVNKGADPTSSPEFNKTLNILEEKCKEKGLDPSVELNKILTEGGIPKERASAIVSARTAPAAKPSILSWLFGGSKDNKAKEAPKKGPRRSRTRFRPR